MDTDVESKLEKSVAYILRDTSENGHLIAVSVLVPCSLARSERPVYWGGNTVVHEKYRGRSIVRFIATVTKYIASAQGQGAVLGRHTITAKTNLPARSSGAIYLGIIPKSIRIKKPNVVADDIIVFYGDHWPRRDKNGLRATSVGTLNNLKALCMYIFC